MKRSFLSCIFICISFYAFSQGSIEGTVTNYKTGEKLPYTDIVLLETKFGVSSNENGFFKLKDIPSGVYKVSVSYVGYKTFYKNITLQNNKTVILNIFLKEEIENLEEVIVTAKSKARKLREQAIPVSVISMRQIQGTVGSITDVLGRTPGVTIRKSGGVGSHTHLSVRGLEGQRIGFFIDEKPMNDLSDFIDINDIPTDMIDRIEIYKGIVPAKLGGNSMGGAVNIVLKEYPKRYADFSYSLGSFNLHKLQTVVKRNLKKQGIELGGGGFYTYADNDYIMENPIIKGLMIKRKHDKFKKAYGGINFTARKWWFDEVKFELPIYYTYRKIQGIKTDIREANITSYAYSFSNSLKKKDFLKEGLDFNMSTMSTYMKYNLVDKAKMNYEWDGRSFPPASHYGGELETRHPSDSDNRRFNMINRVNLEYLINERHTLTFNSVFSLINSYPKDELKEKHFRKKVDFNSKMRGWVIGVGYDFRTKNDKFLNSMVAKHYSYATDTEKQNINTETADVENISLRKNDFGFSNAMRYRLPYNLMVQLSAGYDVRIPSANELLGNGYSIGSSSFLLPEKNLNFNAGLIYNSRGKSKSNLQLEVQGFYMHLKEMIRYVKGILGGQYRNFGEMKTLGIEFEAKADIFPFLYGYGNITYQDLRDVRKYKINSTVPNPTKGKRMPHIPYLLANVGFEFHKQNIFGGKGQNTRIFTDLSFIEKYFYDFEMTELDKRTIPQSTTIDLGIEHSFMYQRLFISGKISNLNNARVLSEFNRPLPGRNFGVKLRYIFK